MLAPTHNLRRDEFPFFSVYSCFPSLFRSVFCSFVCSFACCSLPFAFFLIIIQKQKERKKEKKSLWSSGFCYIQTLTALGVVVKGGVKLEWAGAMERKG